MPVMNGVQATELITGEPAGVPVHDGCGPKVLVLTTFDLDEYVFAALRAGASGFLLKDARPEELLGAIRAVAAGDAVVAPSATRRLLDHVTVSALPGGSARPTDPRCWPLITAREREVLLRSPLGRPTPRSPPALHGGGDRQDPYRSAAGQVERRDRVGLVVFAYENGLTRRLNHHRAAPAPR